jgi:hypothetical protein
MPPKSATKRHDGKESDEEFVLPNATYQSQLAKLCRDDIDECAKYVNKNFAGNIDPSQFKNKGHLSKKIGEIYRATDNAQKRSMNINLKKFQKRQKETKNQRSTALSSPSATKIRKEASRNYQCQSDMAEPVESRKKDITGTLSNIVLTIEQLKREFETLRETIETAYDNHFVDESDKGT